MSQIFVDMFENEQGYVSSGDCDGSCVCYCYSCDKCYDCYCDTGSCDDAGCYC